MFLGDLYIETGHKTSAATRSHLEPAERVLLSEVHGWVVVSVVALPGSPVGLQLVPFGQDGVALIS